jgi:hypothetical protein
MHWMAWAFCLARVSAGNNKPARMAMMAMTTNNSINVKAPRRCFIVVCGLLNGRDAHARVPAHVVLIRI